MRPDYCPVANEPCQLMCAFSEVRCKIRDTAPPQRQPLTEEEILKISDQHGVEGFDPDVIEFTRSIERAHGIRSGDE